MLIFFCASSLGAQRVFAEEAVSDKSAENSAEAAAAADNGPSTAGSTTVAAADNTGRTVIRAGDRINIQIYREKDMSGIFVVDDTGNINYYFLGEIHVDGWTLSQLKSHLIEALGKDLLYNPQIQIAFEAALPSSKEAVLTAKFVSILGQVNRPANYPYVQGMTLVRLISEAGGFAPAAAQNKVKIIRQPEGGSRSVMNVNVARILDGKGEDVVLEPQDVIVVPETFF